MIRKPVLKRSVRGSRSSQSHSVPAPVGGLNILASEASMPATDASVLDNWLPGTTDISLRAGAATHKSALPAVTDTLLTYSSTTTSKLFAATSLGMFDVTTAGAAGASLLAITNGRCNFTNFNTLGGAYTLSVNGVDKLALYNGTVWAFIDGASTPAITGIATTSLSFVTQFKRRIWFVQKDSMSAWYLPVNQIGGAAVEFPVGQLFRKGGKLVALHTWTVDGGSGVDDMLAAITSEGEIAVYQGTDPASATTFALVGVYAVGKPIGDRCFVKFGGDVLMLTEDGIAPLSESLGSGEVGKNVVVTKKIDPGLTAAIKAYRGNFGWSLQIHTPASLLIINVPTTEGIASYQYVMNTVTGAWSKFTGWNATCFATAGEALYFGLPTSVAKGLTGTSDFDADIVGVCRQAYNYLGSRGRQKHVKLIRPSLWTDGSVSVGVGLTTDFADTANITLYPLSVAGGGVWDSSTWDSAVWAGDFTLTSSWYTVTAPEGYCVAVNLHVATKVARIRWSATDFIYAVGGQL